MHFRAGKRSCGMCCTKISGLSVSFGGKTILSDVDLHIHCGELTAIIGPNGAGKSTLLKAIIGEVSHSGKILFTDLKSNRTTRPKIGYVPQVLETDRSAPISVLDLFSVSSSRFPVWLKTRSKTRKLALKFLSEVSSEHLIDRRLGVLSGGELQRVLLALALSSEPDILLLDEPVSGIDSNGLEKFYNIIDKISHNFDLTAIIISHDHKRIARYADRFILLDRSVLSQGTPQDVLSSDEYKNLFGERGTADI